jgi:hypothetical protein
VRGKEGIQTIKKEDKMFLLLLFSFVTAGNLEWEEVKDYDAKAITKQIKESSVVKGYGKYMLKKNLIHFDDEIFESGNKLVVPEGTEILRFPMGLEISKTNIDIVKHDRYTVTYEEGKLKDEWIKLKRESAQEMGISSLENLTVGQISKALSKMNSEGKKYPQKIYISFILVEITGQRKLIPVVLAIFPIGKLLQSIELN